MKLSSISFILALIVISINATHLDFEYDSEEKGVKITKFHATTIKQLRYDFIIEFIKCKRFNHNIFSRYAITDIEVKMMNHHSIKIEESIFEMIIPEEAFVSNYSMILNGKTYTAKVEETDKVRKTDQDSQNNAEPMRENYKTESKDTKKVSKTF